MKSEPFSVFAFLRSAVLGWLKYIFFYTFSFALLFAGGEFFSEGTWRDWAHVMGDFIHEMPVVSLIVYVSFLVGWAGATRKHETHANPFILLLIGAFIASFIPGLAVFEIAHDSVGLSIVAFAFYSVVVSIIIYLFMLWAWFVLGMWGEWWW